MTHRSRAYGLLLSSTPGVPGLPWIPESGDLKPPDLVVHWGDAHPRDDAPTWFTLHTSSALGEDGEPLFRLERGDDDSFLRLTYGDGTTFWVERSFEAADQVWAAWPDDLTSEDTSTYFLGPVLGYLLRMRGQVVLHGSAVAVTTGTPPVTSDGGLRPELSSAVALVGPAGTGKSTTAAAFARRGYPILTEDACALTEPASESEPMLVQPGYPLIRLWPDSVEMLFGSTDALPLLTPTWDKRYLPLDGTEGQVFTEAPCSLVGIFLFRAREDAPDAPRVEPLAPSEAFIELVGNTYRNLVLDREQRTQEFHGLHRLLRTTPVWGIVPHSDPNRLDDLVDLILATVPHPAP